MDFLGKVIGPHKRPFVIAEISCNHDGNFENALRLIREAKLCGADAIKIQCYTPDEMTINANTSDFICKNPWYGMHMYDLYTKTQTPFAWLPGLFNYAREERIPIFASVFGERSLEALEKVNCPAYKIASFEINDVGLLRKVAQTNKPVIMSTGMASFKEIDKATEIIMYNVILMHCVSKYPAPLTETELFKVPRYIMEYGDPIGFSDHTKGYEAAMMAYALGACIFEKHFTLSEKSIDGLFSADSHDFTLYTSKLLTAYAAMNYEDKEKDTQYKRSLYVVKDIKKGEQFTRENIRSIRPGYGMPPILLDAVIGLPATKDISAGTPLKWEIM